MAHRFEKGKPIYFLFKNGYTVQDSQLKPRYYLDRKRAEEYLPYGDEIVEYTPTIEAEPVNHRRWEKRGSKWQCTHCKVLMSIDGTPTENNLLFCPNCGTKMDLEGD